MKKFSVSQLYPTFPLPVIFISGNQVRFIMTQSPDTAPLNLTLHNKKRLPIFSSPAGMLTKLSLAGNNLIIPGQGEFGWCHPGWGRRNRKPFLQCNAGW
jgi:hypothetical protein